MVMCSAIREVGIWQHIHSRHSVVSVRRNGCERNACVSIGERCDVCQSLTHRALAVTVTSGSAKIIRRVPLTTMPVPPPACLARCATRSICQRCRRAGTRSSIDRSPPRGAHMILRTYRPREARCGGSPCSSYWRSRARNCTAGVDTTAAGLPSTHMRTGAKSPVRTADMCSGSALVDQPNLFIAVRTQERRLSASGLRCAFSSRDPDEWKTGEEKMNDAQRSYLETLCHDTGEEFHESLSKAEASKRIDELRQRSPRLSEPTHRR